MVVVLPEVMGLDLFKRLKMKHVAPWIAQNDRNLVVSHVDCQQAHKRYMCACEQYIWPNQQSIAGRTAPSSIHLKCLGTHAGLGAGVLLDEGLDLLQQHTHTLSIAEAQR